MQDVLSFERVGIARYARCERLLHAAPRCSATAWDDLPAELRGRWARMLTHCRRARLLAYRLVSLQSSGQVKPGDAAAYRIAVTKLDQDSAEVLMEIAGRGVPTTIRGRGWFRGEVEDHWRYSQASTVSSGSIEMQRILLSRALLAARMTMILDLSEEAEEYGRQALRAFEAAGGDLLVQQAEADPETAEALGRPGAGRARRVGSRTAQRCRRPGGRRRAVPQRRLLGAALPGRRAAGRGRADLDVDGLVVVAGTRPSAALGGYRAPLGRSHSGRASAAT